MLSVRWYIIVLFTLLQLTLRIDNMLTKVLTVVVLLVLTVATAVHANDERLCGKQLTRTMEIVCEGKFLGLFNKRSAIGESIAKRISICNCILPNGFAHNARS